MGYKTKITVMAALVSMLAACQSSAPGGKSGYFPNYSDADKEQAAAFDPNAYCPKAYLRGGTETYQVFPRGQRDNLARVQLQASILKVARECNYVGDKLQIKIGVAGRYIPGPKREGGTFPMPVRIAVLEGTEPVYSKLHKVNAVLKAGETFGQFQFVDGEILIDKPLKRNITIFVGYDEKGK